MKKIPDEDQFEFARQRNYFPFLSVLCLLLITFGCASPAYRTHPDFTSRARGLQKPALILAEVRIYEISPGGVVQVRDDWSRAGKENLIKALIEAFMGKGSRVTPLTVNEESAEDVREIKALYKAVDKSMRLHGYGPQLFPEKRKRFVYSLGPSEKTLSRLGADSMIFISGSGQISASEQKTCISIAVSDSCGTILWHCVRHTVDQYDLRGVESATDFVEDLLSSFPEVG
ncbi:MAG: hypothetical protein JSV40_05910 [Deltaproteobacteria bacterium]|nr:MAG: hypothetical protein JSV40_05910 [Deltaproteobacteria bacterium]